MTNKLQKSIMRRVYYTFGVRIATHTLTLHALVLAIGLYAFAGLVHVDMVLRNIASVEVGELVPHLMQIVARADVITLVVLGVLTLTTFSIPLRLPQYQKMGLA